MDVAVAKWGPRQATVRRSRFLPLNSCPASYRSSLQALWSFAFAREFLSLSAGLLVGIAVSLWLAVVGLAPYKTGFFELLQTSEGWLVHFPIGLHAGWTCAGELRGSPT